MSAVEPHSVSSPSLVYVGETIRPLTYTGTQRCSLDICPLFGPRGCFWCGSQRSKQEKCEHEHEYFCEVKERLFDGKLNLELV